MCQYTTYTFSCYHPAIMHPFLSEPCPELTPLDAHPIQNKPLPPLPLTQCPSISLEEIYLPFSCHKCHTRYTRHNHTGPVPGAETKTWHLRECSVKMKELEGKNPFAVETEGENQSKEARKARDERRRKARERSVSPKSKPRQPRDEAKEGGKGEKNLNLKSASEKVKRVLRSLKPGRKAEKQTVPKLYLKGGSTPKESENKFSTSPLKAGRNSEKQTLKELPRKSQGGATPPSKSEGTSKLSPTTGTKVIRGLPAEYLGRPVNVVKSAI